MKKVQTLFYLLISAILINGCATQGALTGGDKDITPPKLLKSTPPNYSKNFTGDSFTLTFDEYVDVKDQTNQLIISPPLALPPDIRIKNKSVVFTFKNKLIENTTYSINFGTSIADINEGNKLDNFKYIFSTGPVLDSLIVKGNVKDALTNKSEKGLLVMLYKTQEDSAPLKQKPFYFGKTNDQGYFNIGNVAPGNYKIIALKDQNSDYLFNQAEESIGFEDKLINPLNKDTINLRVFEQSNPKLYLVKNQALEYGHLQFIFSKPTKNLTFHSLKYALSDFSVLKEVNRTQDTVQFWYKDIPTDSLTLSILNDGVPFDTVSMGLLKKTEGRKIRGKKFTTPLLSTNLNSGPLDQNADINITASHPIKEYELKKISLKEDSTLIDNFLIASKDSVARKYSIVYPWKETSTYHLLIPKGTFIDIFENVNDTVKADFKIRPAGDYGTVSAKLTFKGTPRSTIVQLLNDKGAVVRENYIDDHQNIDYTFLNPGVYQLRTISDENGNRKWDTGDYLNHKQPERVSYYKEQISIRADWDLEVNWLID